MPSLSGLNLVEHPVVTKQPVHPIVRQLRERRIKMGVLQREVAVKCGVTATCVTDWESGSTHPNIHKLQAWANSLDMALTLMDLGEDW